MSEDVFIDMLEDDQQPPDEGLDATICCASSESEWKPDYTKTPRRVVCAANRHHHSRLVICGARHWDKVMRAQAVALGTPSEEWDQGFIDQFGCWMTREEAWIVAANQNQIRRRCGGDGERLFSENLY
jgi:hypothetical protein